MPVLDEILEHRAKQSGGAAGGSVRKAGRRLCLVTCCEPSMNRLEQALGLGPQDAAVLRYPGPALNDEAEFARAVVSTMLMADCEEVLVVAHTNCAFLSFDVSSAGELFARREIPRSAIPFDVRSFFGVQPSARQTATAAAAAIRSQSFLPGSALVHAAVFDPDSGEFTVVERGENLGIAQAERSSPFGQVGPVSMAGPSLGAIGNALSQAAGKVDFGSALPSGLGLDAAPTPENASILGLGVSVVMGKPPELPIPTMEFRPSISLEPGGSIQPPQTFQPTPPAFQPPPPQPVRTAPPPRPQKQPKQAPARGPKPPQQQPRQGPPPLKPQAAPASRGLPPMSPALTASVEKIRLFYRAEMDASVRSQTASRLGQAFGAGADAGELIKVVYKPVLESGPKRYKVIDELLSLKEAAAGMSRENCYAALRHLVE